MKFSMFRYFFLGILILALMTAVIGVNITFWQNYTIETQQEVITNVNWFSIKRLDTSFWDTFRALSRTYDTMFSFNFLPRLPNIPLIPTFNVGGWFIVIDLLINVVNGLSTLINVVITILNTIRDLIVAVSAFFNAFTIWVANAGAGAVPIIYNA